MVSLTESIQPYNDPGLESASKLKEYQEYLLEVKAAGAMG